MVDAPTRLAAVRHDLRVEGPQVVRIVIAVAVSWQVCVWLGAQHPPVYAVVVPLVAMRDAPDSAFNVSIARVVGVVAGLGLGMAVLSWLRPSTAAVALVMAVALLLGIVLRIGGVLNVQVAVSALLVFANDDPSSYALARFWETGVGAVVTVLLSPLLLPTNPARAFTRALHGVAASAGENLLLAAELLSTAPATGGDGPAHRELAARLETQSVDADARARALATRLAAARRAVRIHPVWRRRHGDELGGLVAPADTAPEVTALVRSHVADVVELGGRTDEHDWLALVAPLTRAVAIPLAEAVTACLTGEPGGEALDRAAAALKAHALADPSRLGAVIRRPLRRMITVLSDPVEQAA